MPGTLYVISTPIGNLEDITLRAIRILKEVDLVAAEDPKSTRVLLDHYGISVPVTSYHNLNKEEKTPVLLQRLHEGQRVALVSEAGTPAVFDPGSYLITSAHKAGVRVVPIPGPSAVLAALAVSGLSADSFVFCGQVPGTAGRRQRFLEALRFEPRPAVLFAAPNDIRPTLLAVRAPAGRRRFFLAEEMTMPGEAFLQGTAEEILKALGSRPIRGEVTLVVEGARRRKTKAEHTQTGRARATRRIASES